MVRGCLVTCEIRPHSRKCQRIQRWGWWGVMFQNRWHGLGEISPWELKGFKLYVFPNAFLPLLRCEKGSFSSREPGSGLHGNAVVGCVCGRSTMFDVSRGAEWLRGHIVSILIIMLRDLYLCAVGDTTRVFFTTSLWPAGCGTSWLARWQKIWMTTLHIAQWACEIRFWAQPKRIPKSTVYRLRRIYCGFSKVLIESIMACGIVKFPLKIAFDLETTPYIYFELPGDLSARGPAAWICAPHISHIRKQVWCRAS